MKYLLILFTCISFGQFNPIFRSDYRPRLITHFDAGNISSYPGTGTTWLDISGNGNHNDATLFNGVTYDSANGGSFLFDGSNDYAGLNLYPLSISHSFNIWVKIVSNTTGGAFICSGNPNQISFLQVGVSFNLAFNYAFNSPVSAAPIGTWMMLTGVHTATQDKLYINGTLITTATTVPPIYLGKNITIGKRLDNTYINSYISSVKIYNYAISQTEITANFNALRGRYGL